MVWNERLKLGAAALNGVALAVVGIGVLAPLAAVLYGTVAVRLSAGFGFVVVLWLAFAAVFHAGAQRVLGGLRG